jgi:hypothetical protein
MKVDGGLEVVLFTEAIGHLLDRLNLGVQAITHGTGDSFLEVSGDMGPVAFDHLGHRPQRCQTRMSRPSEPARPEACCLRRCVLRPEFAQTLLDGPGPSLLEVQALCGSRSVPDASRHTTTDT